MKRDELLLPCLQIDTQDNQHLQRLGSEVSKLCALAANVIGPVRTLRPRSAENVAAPQTMNLWRSCQSGALCIAFLPAAVTRIGPAAVRSLHLRCDSVNPLSGVLGRGPGSLEPSAP